MKIIKSKILFVIIVLVFLFIPSVKSFAQSQSEKISNFQSNITINKDATISISETIDYYFPSEKHGIYRTIPYIYKDKNNKKYKSLIGVQSVLRDGNSEKYEVSSNGNNFQIKIGDKNQTISGNHQYQINYEVKGFINHFNEHDELYYNVTGNDWDVGIEKVSAKVVLPESVDISKINFVCYSGSFGSTSQNCTKNQNKNTVEFSSNDLLTVVVGWNKGVVDVVSKEYIYDWSKFFMSFWWLLLAPIIFGILFWRYLKFGKDPRKITTIAPEFSAPKGYLPAEIGVVYDEKTDKKDMSATIINWAVKGYLKIVEKNKKFQLEKLKDPKDLKDFEQELFDFLFKSSDKVSMDDLKDQAKELTKSPFYSFSDSLYQEVVGEKLFVNNPQKTRNLYLFGGIALAGVGLFTFGFLYLLSVAIFLIGVILFIFSKAMPKKTLSGVEVLQKSLGYKMFIEKAEKYRLKWQENENIFSEVLPYAMVFGISKKWISKFKNLDMKNLDWYQSDRSFVNTLIIYSIISNFDSSVSSNVGAVSASSGGSGFSGGFSGGGFGGGGGGSW